MHLCTQSREQSPVPTQAGELVNLVTQRLGDLTHVRSPDPLALQHVSRAQQWVATRYRLLRQTMPLTLAANSTLYYLPSLFPRLLSVVSVLHADGTPLWPVRLSSLRYKDVGWIRTTGTPAWYYRVGWTYLGVYPVPTVAEAVRITAYIFPLDLATLTSYLDISDNYVPQVTLFAAGTLAMTRERQYAQGGTWIREALGLAGATESGAV